MKKIFLLIAVAVFGVSCINEDFESMKLDLDNLSPFTEELAPIQEGKTTIIKANGVVICETNIEMSYSFPKGALKTTDYIANKKDVIYGGWDVNTFTAAFEDTRNGDNDYNDFVCYITREKKTSGDNVQLDIYIQPIAYGAGTNLQFGITLPNGVDTIISTNIRNDFFPGTTGFVNTVDPSASLYQTGDTNHIKKITYTQLGKQNDFLRIHPFIINENGEKIYVALSANNISTNYTSIASVTGYPLGIAIATSGGFDYPTEKTNISTVYQGFNSWVTGSNTSIGNLDNSNDAKSKVFDISNLINKNPQNLFNK